MDRSQQLKELKKKVGTKLLRTFSDEFKKKTVKDIESKAITVRQVVNLYQVSSVAVYKWLQKYSTTYQKGTRMVLELESEAEKTEYLINRLSDLERVVGQKQIEIEFLNKMLEKCSEELGYDVKKNFHTRQSNGSE